MDQVSDMDMAYGACSDAPPCDPTLPDAWQTSGFHRPLYTFLPIISLFFSPIGGGKSELCCGVSRVGFRPLMVEWVPNLRKLVAVVGDGTRLVRLVFTGKNLVLSAFTRHLSFVLLLGIWNKNGGRKSGEIFEGRALLLRGLSWM